MISPSTEISLVIQEKESFSIENFQVEVISYLGLLTADVHYFKVNIQSSDIQSNSTKLGLLRVGSLQGGLSRELKLRETLNGYGMIVELLAHCIKESVLINPPLTSLEQELEEYNSEKTTTEEESINISPSVVKEKLEDLVIKIEPFSDTLESDREISVEWDYLEEEYYPEKEITSFSSNQKLLILTDYPDDNSTLNTWLKDKHSLEESLSLAIQICQLFHYVHQRQWCLVNILPQMIEIGKPLRFFDLTFAYPVGASLNSGLVGNYCAPELAFAPPLNESMSSYTIGALLYQIIHQKLLLPEEQLEPKIQPIPQIYQLLRISLSLISEERFILSQLLKLLIEIRNSFRILHIEWNIASKSTVGLSISRLKNEDNYGVKQEYLSNSKPLLLGVVADGMGGMSQGEEASQVAMQTILSEPINIDLDTEQQRGEWLVSLFQKANQSVAQTVRDGGTTLSVVLAIGDELAIAHVGDSRIYLLRKGEIYQLSEDHSLVAMLFASSQITYEESLKHPDRNVLTKSLGSKPRLSDGYVQTSISTNKNSSMKLEDNDILLLCSDGVWDLVSDKELAEIFIGTQSLQLAVNRTINRVLEQGASDNATLLAMQCSIRKANQYVYPMS